MEKPSNQINILEDKINLLANLLVEWKSYETVLNLSYNELKEMHQIGKDKKKKSEDRPHPHETLRTKGESTPHDISFANSKPNSANLTDPDLNSGNETEAEEQGQGDLESLFGTEEAEKFEIEFEEMRKRTANLFGEKDTFREENAVDIEVSPSFINEIIPEISINPHRFESLDSIEDALDTVKLDDGTGENKLITELLNDHLFRLENENLTTKQKNKLNQIRRIVNKISEIRIYNPKLLEKLVQNMN